MISIVRETKETRVAVQLGTAGASTARQGRPSAIPR